MKRDQPMKRDQKIDRDEVRAEVPMLEGTRLRVRLEQAFETAARRH